MSNDFGAEEIRDRILEKAGEMGLNFEEWPPVKEGDGHPPPRDWLIDPIESEVGGKRPFDKGSVLEG
jgi:hypothetical protein